MKTKRKLNVKLLRRIQKHITEEPRRFLMSDWSVKAKDEGEWLQKTLWQGDSSESMPPCGTAACIAGTANLLTGGRKLNLADRAAKLLGVASFSRCEYAESNHPLFHVEGWPKRFRKAYDKATTPKKRVKVACARIDHLIKTGE